ncbi:MULTISPECIES: hypothetical protein [Lysobacter]|jgi:hypothetical protein|uniref:DUF8082 domain-containing protein n=1 Tax=Lysobacter gummosus TaxID=262324 RepID=A0ABY3XAQ7_9GAMM|nr:MULTISPECIES: hypothetical protein [Lysobacter]ALN91836.1 hypothetical protein LG3211_2872 [Lysobacter gummosus]UJB21169.1 hypothetical protein L1A79_08980 [Lysobacter capsici]UJQ29716.1 hypothetical protein L2D09_05880 [Lysobacter gummosus]UNP27501.1 hypothetical protein MOV92_13275 [Lysobacter gummosus]
MSNDFRPLIEVLRELRTLVQKRASGFLFIVTEENHSCIIRLNGGQVQEVLFRMMRNDEAVQRLAMVASAKLRFQSGDSPASAKSALSESSMQWLLGGFEQDLAARRLPTPTPAASPVRVDRRVRDAIEQAAVNYLGPIAGMLCDEAFETLSTPQQVVAQLATNLNSPEEARRFIEDARKALDALR